MRNNTSLSLITKNETMRTILSKIDRVVNSDSSILLIGETGVGKEIFSDYIHRTSHRSEQPYVKISLSAIPPDLLESELFGHEKGSYTSASNEKKGLFEIANKGTILLDDIDDVPMSIQKKLLRVLEAKEIMRVGGTDVIPIDVRVISASKIDLKELVKQKKFRADLFYRLNVVPIHIPPLRERRDDIPLLIDHFLKIFSQGKKLTVSKEALKLLVNYSWPGNVRELKNVIKRQALFTEKVIYPSNLSLEIRNENSWQNLLKKCNQCFIEESINFESVVSCLEHNLLYSALEKTNGNQTQAAKILGLNLSTFRDKIKKYKSKSIP